MNPWSASRLFLVALIVCFGPDPQLWGQQVAWTFVDEARNNREIPVDFRFDPMQTGPFPLVVLGHGFLLGPEDYDDMSGFLTEAGFAVALLGTETGLTPSHVDFGQDMAFVANHASDEVGDALEGMIAPASALVGHSMGGGAAWLGAAQMGNALDAVIGWAPAETNPSAINAAAELASPALVISGTADAITPPAMSHIPIYDALPSAICRGFASLENGSHCGFSDSSSLCDLGEFGFSGMSREIQQLHSATLTVAWLKFHLLGEASAWSDLMGHAEAVPEISLTLSCQTSSVSTPMSATKAMCHPNPVSRILHLDIPWQKTPAPILSLTGQHMGTWSPQSGANVNVTSLPSGVYLIHLLQGNQPQVLRFIKQP